MNMSAERTIFIISAGNTTILHFTCIILHLFNEAVIQDADGVLEVLVVHTEDDVEFVRTLVDHADVDARFAESGKDLTGNTGTEGHLTADSGASASVGITTETLSMPLGT